MGNAYGDFTSTNINQTQMTSITQSCNESAGAVISGLNITAIDSHLGDIDLVSSVVVGNMNCVMSAFVQNAVTAAVSDTSNSDIKQAFPFQLNLNVQAIENITDIHSFQQAIISQSCTESAAADVSNVNLTFIDSSTGNITVASTTSVQSFSCNLQASSYQTAAASVVNSSTGSISAGCCGFDLGMIVPILLGLIGLIVVSKLATKSGGRTAGGGDDGGTALAEASREATTANLIAQLSAPMSRPSSQAPMGGQSAAMAGTRARTIPVGSGAGAAVRV